MKIVLLTDKYNEDGYKFSMAHGDILRAVWDRKFNGLRGVPEESIGMGIQCTGILKEGEYAVLSDNPKMAIENLKKSDCIYDCCGW